MISLCIASLESFYQTLQSWKGTLTDSRFVERSPKKKRKKKPNSIERSHSLPFGERRVSNGIKVTWWVIRGSHAPRSSWTSADLDRFVFSQCLSSSQSSVLQHTSNSGCVTVCQSCQKLTIKPRVRACTCTELTLKCVKSSFKEKGQQNDERNLSDDVKIAKRWQKKLIHLQRKVLNITNVSLTQWLRTRKPKLSV